MDQDSEVADLLGDLVEDDGDRRGDTQFRAHQVTRTDHQAINEVVDAVGEENHLAERVDGVIEIGRLIVMMPVEILLNDEEDENAGDNEEREGGGVRYLLEAFGDEMDEGVTQEGPHREGDEEEDILLDQIFADREGEDADQGDEAHREDAQEGEIEGHHLFLHKCDIWARMLEAQTLGRALQRFSITFCREEGL